MDHITRGRYLKGWHHRPSGDPSKHRIKPGTQSPKDPQGCYRAVMESKNQDGKWYPKNNPHTFFPDAWSEKRVLSEVRGAHARAVREGNVQPNGRWRGVSRSGVEIAGWVRSGKIVTAYPIPKEGKPL